MNSYQKRIQQIDEECYRNMPSQIVIDLIQEAEEELVTFETVERDTIGSFSYQVSILLEVFNPEMKDDIALLEKLHAILKEWFDDVNYADKILGVKH